MKKRRGRKLFLGCALGLSVTVQLAGCGGPEPKQPETVVEAPPVVETPIEEEPELVTGVAIEDRSAFAERYYFQQLDEPKQQLYAELYAQIDELAEDITLATPVDSDVFHESYYALMLDCPEFFWLGSNLKVVTIEQTEQVTAVAISFETVSREEVISQRNAVAEIAEQWISEIDPAADSYEKIKQIYERVAENTEYVEDSPYNQDIRSVFLNRQSVCAGYAKAVEYLLTKMNISATIVNGNLVGGMPHCWNLVQIGADYYWLDVTQGDSSADGDTIYYAYLCFDDEMLNQNYVITKTIGLSTVPDREREFYQYPACNSIEYNYYQRQGLRFDYFDREQIQEYIYQAASEGERTFSFQFVNENDFNEATAALEDQSLLASVLQELMSEQGISNWQYRYSSDAMSRVVNLML